jgi:lon-related putative ATP-dependent protease
MESLEELVQQGELSEADRDRLVELHKRFSERLHDVFLKVADLRRQASEQVETVRREAIRPFLDSAINRVQSSVSDDGAKSFLDAVRADLEEYLEVFGESPEQGMEEDPFLRWRVNLAVDNAEAAGHPVVIETEPTFANVFGTVERMFNRAGEAVTSFMRIRAGSLLTANGGFLVLNADDLLLDGRVWPALKRALKYRRVQIQSYESSILGAAALKPEPVPLNVKVVIIGSRGIYDALYRYDSDFAKVFKVLADFDSVMLPTKDNARDILSVLRKVSDEENLLPLDRSGMAAIIEQAVRLGRWRHRMSSRFSDLSDVVREASYFAAQDGSEIVTRDHVKKAESEYRYRHGLSEDRSHELLEEMVYRVETEGSAIGQLNGLAVYDLGHHRFGKPSRITARVGLGREGVINIERHAGLSGPTHDKGVQILTGFLRGQLARTVPLSMSCSVTFEQSYGGIDGDSASSTEVYAILSALAEVPLSQEIAVTGSVDQNGQIQSIGGVNQKIEGFFRICESRGLTGSQGVMIPASNVEDLQLADEVVDAVREGYFHVWSVATIEEGIELLTGESAGEWDDEEGFPEESIYGRCQARIEEMAQLLRNAGKEKTNDDEGNNGESTDGESDEEKSGEESS